MPKMLANMRYIYIYIKEKRGRELLNNCKKKKKSRELLNYCIHLKCITECKFAQ